MKNIFRKTLMSFGIIAILFVFNTAEMLKRFLSIIVPT